MKEASVIIEEMRIVVIEMKKLVLEMNRNSILKNGLPFIGTFSRFKKRAYECELLNESIITYRLTEDESNTYNVLIEMYSQAVIDFKKIESGHNSTLDKII